MVVFWKQYETTDKQTGQPTTVPVMRYYNVFNAEQVESIEIPDAVKFEPIDFKPIEAAERIAAGYLAGPTFPMMADSRRFSSCHRYRSHAGADPVCIGGDFIRRFTMNTRTRQATAHGWTERLTPTPNRSDLPITARRNWLRKCPRLSSARVPAFSRR